jgi:hypothetical protein
LVEHMVKIGQCMILHILICYFLISTGWSLSRNHQKVWRCQGHPWRRRSCILKDLGSWREAFRKLHEEGQRIRFQGPLR